MGRQNSSEKARSRKWIETITEYGGYARDYAREARQAINQSQAESRISEVNQGIRQKIKIISHGWNSWEFVALFVSVMLILYIIFKFFVPLLVGFNESNITPEKQEYAYESAFNESSTIDDGRLIMNCSPTNRYLKPESTIRCEYKIINRSDNSLKNFEKEFIERHRGDEFIESYWLDERYQQYQFPSTIHLFHDRYNRSRSNYTIQGEIRLSAPSEPGLHYLRVETVDQFDVYYADTEPIIVYSEAEVANFRYRELVAPVEQLVAIGVLISLFKLVMTLSTRLSNKL